MGDELKKTADDAKDAMREVKHRTEAEMEHAKRDAVNDEMTTGEKVKSHLHEDAERTKADLDHAKRKVRDNT